MKWGNLSFPSTRCWSGFSSAIRSASRQKYRDRGEPGEERVCSEHEPRNPHAAEWRDGDDGPGAGDRTDPRAAGILRYGENVGRFAAYGNQRHPAFLQDRSVENRLG